MSDFHAALGGMIAATGVGMTMVGRHWPTPTGSRRRRGDDVSDELMTELLGPPSPWTEFEHAPGVIRQGFDDCPACGQCLTPVVGRAA